MMLAFSQTVTKRGGIISTTIYDTSQFLVLINKLVCAFSNPSLLLRHKKKMQENLIDA